MKRLALSLAAALLAASVHASRPFEVMGDYAASLFDTGNIARPAALQDTGLNSLQAILTGVDNSGEVVHIPFDIDPDDEEGSIERAISDLRFTVNTATRNAARALARTATLATMVHDNAQKIEDTLSNLVAAFLLISTIEIEDPETHETQSIPVKVEKDKVTVVGGAGSPVRTDGLSISSNSAGRLEVAGFSTDQTSLDYCFPYRRGDGFGIQWDPLGNFFDGETLPTDETTGIGIMGFRQNHASGSSHGFCADSIAQQLTRTTGTTDHYALTAYKGGGTTRLHYTPIGTLTNLNVSVDTPWGWNTSTKSFTNPYAQVGSRTVSVEVGSNLSDGNYSVAVDMESGTASLVQGTPTPTDTTAYYFVGTVSGGELVDGPHATPVCLYWE